MFQKRVLSPTVRSKVLHLFHEDHSITVAIKQLSRFIIRHPGLDKDVSTNVNIVIFVKWFELKRLLLSLLGLQPHVISVELLMIISLLTRNFILSQYY